MKIDEGRTTKSRRTRVPLGSSQFPNSLVLAALRCRASYTAACSRVLSGAGPGRPPGKCHLAWLSSGVGGGGVGRVGGGCSCPLRSGRSSQGPYMQMCSTDPLNPQLPGGAGLQGTARKRAREFVWLCGEIRRTFIHSLTQQTSAEPWGGLWALPQLPPQAPAPRGPTVP